ncbi:TniB family NTP-binding protein [Streptomyces sp. NBC_00853]|uniref:TniB family NTP-binding protein n=1 Tax=Streptomyces sp. NBC_00853 TaxID=2903681 RepID=UPI0038732A41
MDRGRADSDGRRAQLSWPITSWQGWQKFVHAPPPVPPAPDAPARSVEERLAYHSVFVTFRTPTVDTLAASVRTLMVLGRYQQTTARSSLIVTGPAAAGKTTALLHVGRTCHLAHTRTTAPPHKPTDAQVPVAYVLVPPGATGKMLAAEFARYLGIPVSSRMTQITESVCHTYNQVGVRLVLIECGPLPPASATSTPSPASSPTSKTPSISTTTGLAPSPATPPTSSACCIARSKSGPSGVLLGGMSALVGCSGGAWTTLCLEVVFR